MGSHRSPPVGLAQAFQVKARLQGEPPFGTIAAQPTEAQRHFRGDRRMLGQDGMQGLSGNAKQARDLCPSAGRTSSRNNSPGCIAGNPFWI